MKLNAGKRILMFFHWLFSLLICAAFALQIIRPEWAQGIYDGVLGSLSNTQAMVIGVAILAIYVVLTVVQACIIFHRAKHEDRGFITVDSSDSGRVRIAVNAIEQMVRQSIVNIDGITDMRIGIENKDDTIDISINTTLQNGCHVPTVTMNMQRAIRQFVEMNCGVAVRSVSISINAVAASNEGGRRWSRRRDAKAADAPVPVYAPPVEPVAEPGTDIHENAVEDVSRSEDAPVYIEQNAVSEAVPADEGPVEGEPVAQEAPVAEEESGEDFIPDPKPITLRFDHLPEQPTEAPAGTEAVDDEQ